jgi:hypothetical protein
MESLLLGFDIGTVTGSSFVAFLTEFCLDAALDSDTSKAKQRLIKFISRNTKKEILSNKNQTKKYITHPDV